MSSVPRTLSNTKQGNDFFINVAAFAIGDTFTYNESAGTISADGALPAGFTAGAVGTMLVKDMGKTVSVAGAYYRKVQAFSIAGAADASLAAHTTFILLNPATGNACKWARMTLQA